MKVIIIHVICSFCYLRVHLYHHLYQLWCWLSLCFTTWAQHLKDICFCVNVETS